jgi:hypothetical protein
MGVTDWFPATTPPYWWGTYELYEEDIGIVGCFIYVFGKWHWPNGHTEPVHEWKNAAWRGLTQPWNGDQ